METKLHIPETKEEAIKAVSTFLREQSELPSDIVLGDFTFVSPSGRSIPWEEGMKTEHIIAQVQDELKDSARIELDFCENPDFHAAYQFTKEYGESLPATMLFNGVSIEVNPIAEEFFDVLQKLGEALKVEEDNDGIFIPSESLEAISEKVGTASALCMVTALANAYEVDVHFSFFGVNGDVSPGVGLEEVKRLYNHLLLQDADRQSEF